MITSRLPTWVLVLVGVVAVVAGALGVVHAPPAIGKAMWAAITAIGVVALGLALRHRPVRADDR